MTSHEPLIDPVKLSELRPTQITVGLREVREKRRQWRDHVDHDGQQFLGRHMIPVVLGPKGRRYIVDHHHLARALMDEGVEDVLVDPLADLSGLTKDAFWVFLDHRGWCFPYDAAGQRVDFEQIPRSVGEMLDDPWRSLAGELRRAGGFAKDPMPFSEFLWADFLRRRMRPKLLERDFPAALTQALTLARGKDAQYLPGWCGPDPIS